MAAIVTVFITSVARAQSANIDEPLIIATHDQPTAIDNVAQDDCLPVNEIRIYGLSLVDSETMRTTLQPLAYQCIGNALTHAIVRAIDETHSENGYVTTKGHILEQDIRKSARLEIEIVTGRVGKIIYVEKSHDAGADYSARISDTWKSTREAKSTWNIVNALSDLLHAADDPIDRFQILDGENWPALKRWGATNIQPNDAVNIDHLQQSVDVYNSLPSNHVSYNVVPTDTPAISDAILTNNRDDSFSLIAGYELNGISLSNRGNTINKKLQIELAKDNFIGINDRWRTVFASGPDSTELKGYFTIPWRRFSFSASGGYFESITRVLPAAEYYYRSIEANTAVTYLLEHARTHNTRLETALGWRKIERCANEYHLPTKQISTGRIGFSRTHYMTTVEDNGSFLLGRELKYGLGYTQGLPLLGATPDGPKPSPAMPRTHFWKIDGKAALKQGFRNIGTLSMELTGQWSEYPLYSDDQLSLGSLWTIRGFNDTLGKADRGILLRTEFAPTLPINKIIDETFKQDWSFFADMLQSAQPYVFVDAGHGRDIAAKKDLTRASFGGGLRVSYGRTNLDISVVHRAVERGTLHIQKSPEVYFTINTKML